MIGKNELLLKYFFLYGIPEEETKKYKTNELKEDNNLNPILLSSYSAEGKTELFKMCEQLLDEDIYLQNNIFPKKADFLSDLIFHKNILDPPTLKLKKNPFNQYIYNANSFSNIPEPFSHCFQYIFKMDETKEDNIILNFAVLIFFENVTDERDLFEENKEKNIFSFLSKSKYYHTFIGKAIILVSEKPIFSLMIKILQILYINYIKKKYTYFPIEQIIINIFEKINGDNDNNEEEDVFNEIRKIKLYKEPLLPFCDFNISFFFKIFNLQDIFLIAEYYLCSKNIIIVSSSIEFLFPIYYIFMTLFFPLNKNSNERFYKLLVPDEQNLQRTLFGMLPTFQFIYNDNKLDEEILKNICKIKEDILIYQIFKINPKNNTFEKSGKIWQYNNNKDKFIKIDILKYITIIQKVLCLNQEIYLDLKDFLNNDIKEIQNYFNNYKKTPTFFDYSFDYKKYDGLRNHFIGLFIKFFVTCLKPIKFNLNDKKIEIDIIDFKKFPNDSSADELLSNLYTTPQSDLIYKNEIIKSGKFDNKNLKKIILLDYFMKISSMDKKRSYFEPKSSKDENKEIIIDSKKLLFGIIEFFKYGKIINENKNIFYYINRIYLYPLQHSKKIFLKIGPARSFIEHFEYYQVLTKIDKSEDIKRIKETNGLDYIIYFGENFILHFGQFINNNYKLLSYNNDNDKDYLNLTHIDVYKNDEIYEKYYKLTLDEAEIFYELFITQIIISENRKELASCAIGLFISIYIINLLTELSSKKPNNEILEIINKNKDKLYKLFEITNGFYGRYDFLITLLFEIVSSYQFAQKYTNLLIEKLEKEKILPSIIIILMQNHNISLNFREIKKYIEKNDLVNKNNNILEQRKTIGYQKDEEEKKIKMNDVLEQLKNKMKKGNIKLNKNKLNNESNEKESTKEILIYNLERNKHEHEYNIIDGINNDYTCVQNCEDIMSFTIQKTKDGDKEKIFIFNPKYIINKILKKILDKNTLFIYPYEGVNNDIYQIALLDELYFKIGFFKYQKNGDEAKE